MIIPRIPFRKFKLHNPKKIPNRPRLQGTDDFLAKSGDVGMPFNVETTF
jgi:hypothetical protein